MEAVHAHEIIHLDLKPDNVLIGPLDVPWITDFGLSTSADLRTVQQLGYVVQAQLLSHFGIRELVFLLQGTAQPPANVSKSILTFGRVLLDAERVPAPELDSELYRGLGLIGARVLDGVSQSAAAGQQQHTRLDERRS
jgi:serine/threonine protein kinase